MEEVKMITLEEKEKMWQDVLKEFPSYPMLRDLHFMIGMLTNKTGHDQKIDTGKIPRVITAEKYG